VFDLIALRCLTESTTLFYLLLNCEAHDFLHCVFFSVSYNSIFVTSMHTVSQEHG